MLYQIGEFSIITKMTVKTLRYYHEQELLIPVKVDTASGYRFYDKNSLERAGLLHRLKNLDFSIKEIREIVETCKDDADLALLAEKKIREVKEKIKKYRSIEKELVQLRISQGENVMEHKTYNVIIKNIEDTQIASIRFKGKYHEVGDAFRQLFKKGARLINGKTMTLYYDGEYKEEGADLEACIPVKKELQSGTIQSRNLHGGRVVSYVYQGAYENIGEGYQVILDYVKEHNIETILPSREVYLKHPGMIFKGNPKKYLTEIQMLIKE